MGGKKFKMKTSNKNQRVNAKPNNEIFSNRNYQPVTRRLNKTPKFNKTLSPI